MISRKYLLLLFVSCLLVVLWGTGCENTFKPLEEGGEHNFTMYGALDLHADTQWVRVMPIGEQLIPSKLENSTEKVELIREKTGETIVLNDSMFVFGRDAIVWNYWTTEQLHPNEVYTIRAESQEGELSSATVNIPSPLPRPTVEVVDEHDGIVRGISSSPLVTVDLELQVQLVSEVGSVSPPREYRLSLLDQVRRDAKGEYFFNYSIDDLLFQELNMRSGYIVSNKTLVLIKGSEDWPDLSDFSELETGIPNVASNIENGTGYIAGIARREMPLKSCYDDQEDLIPCEISSSYKLN